MKVVTGIKKIGFDKWDGMTPEEVDREVHEDSIQWLSEHGWNAPKLLAKDIDHKRGSNRINKNKLHRR